jgi:chaperonin GroEL (HSP60 family)
LDGKGSVHALGIISASVFPHGKFPDIADKILRDTTTLTVRDVCKSDVLLFHLSIKILVALWLL